MTPQPKQPDLPLQIQQDLAAAGGVSAPEELWERVQVARALGELAPISAPEELWKRVQSSLPQRPAKPRGALWFGLFGSSKRQLSTAAAAALLLGGLAFLFPVWKPVSPAQNSVVLATQTPEAVRAAFRARAEFHVVAPAAMSEFARGLAQSLGGLMVEDDA